MKVQKDDKIRKINKEKIEKRIEGMKEGLREKERGAK